MCNCFNNRKRERRERERDKDFAVISFSLSLTKYNSNILRTVLYVDFCIHYFSFYSAGGKQDPKYIPFL